MAMKYLKGSGVGLALLAFAAFSESALGGVVVNPIFWGPATTISGDNDVSTLGTLVAAFDMNGTGATVNGVTFAPFAVTTGTQGTTNGNFSFGENPGHLIAYNTLGSASAPFSNLSASYRTILNTALSTDDNNTLFFSISGLVVGRVYQFEFWTNASSHVGGGNGFATTGSAGFSVSLDDNTTDAQGGLGQFAIGTFTAVTSVQQITFTGTNSAQAPTINAFQLRAVPEPATFGLLALGAGVLGIARRIRRPASLNA